MISELYLASVLVVAGAVLTWNDHEFLRVVRSRTGESFPVLGSGLTAYIIRPWRLFTGFDRLVRVELARNTDPVIEAARRQFLRRRRLIVLGFLVAAILGILLIPWS